MARKKEKSSKKKAGKRRPPSLAWSFTVMCDNRRHVVGVTRGGCLYFPDHAVRDLRRELEFRDLGGCPCKCAEILENWRKGEFTVSVPQFFALERVGRDDVLGRKIRRLQKRMRRNFPPGQPASGPPLEAHVCNDLTSRIVEELRRRGAKINYRGQHEFRHEGTPEPDKYMRDRHKISVSINNRGQVGFYIDNKVIPLPAALLAAPPVRALADVAERHYLTHLILEAEGRRGGKVAAASAARAASLKKDFPSEHGSVCAHDGLFSVTFSLVGMTYQAARKVLEAHETVRGRMVRYKNAGEVRGGNPNRYPGVSEV